MNIPLGINLLSISLLNVKWYFALTPTKKHRAGSTTAQVHYSAFVDTQPTMAGAALPGARKCRKSVFTDVGRMVVHLNPGRKEWFALVRGSSLVLRYEGLVEV